MAKSVCIITGTRAEYGLLKPLIEEIRSSEKLELRLVVTGAHLDAAFGETYREIEGDGFPIHEKIKMPLDSDTHGGMAIAAGAGIILFNGYFETHRPDMAVVLGDRYEILSAAISASMLQIPIAHISGGDTSAGAVDEFIRHSITKMSYLHFTTNEISRRRVIQLGESPERVFNTGALNIDNILSRKLLTVDELGAGLGVDLSGQYALVTYHPVTMNGKTDATAEFGELLKAIGEFQDMKFLFTKANADSGGRAINEELDKFVASRGSCMAFASLGAARYLSAMKHASIVIGNSSSGLYETPSFGVPCVNIGDRQKGRLRAGNVIDCPGDSASIAAAIRKARSDEFVDIARRAENPFGDGHAAERMVEAIERFLFDETIDLKKSFYDIGGADLQDLSEGSL